MIQKQHLILFYIIIPLLYQVCNRDSEVWDVVKGHIWQAAQEGDARTDTRRHTL